MISQDINVPDRYNAIYHILLYDWDPIGISDLPEAHDEYEAYVKQINEMFERGTCQRELFDFLWQVETKYMSLIGDSVRTEKCVDKLLKLC